MGMVGTVELSRTVVVAVVVAIIGFEIDCQQYVVERSSTEQGCKGDDYYSDLIFSKENFELS